MLKMFQSLAGIAGISLGITCSVVARPDPVGTAFTYQGHLSLGGAAVDDTADFQFSLFDEAVGGNQIGATQTVNAIDVVDGGFTVDIDFGAGVFGIHSRWLDIAVRSPAGSGTFTPLTPRQRMHPTPVSQFALGGSGTFSGTFTGTISGNASNLTNVDAANITGTLPSSALNGTYGGAVTFTNAGNNFAGTFAGNGAGLNALNASTIISGTLSETRLPSTLLDRIPDLNFAPTQVGTFGSMGSVMTIVGTRLYTISSGWRVYDISNPEQPVHLGGGPTEGVTRTIEVAGTTIYETHSSGASELLRIYDASNPASITMQGTVSLVGPAISAPLCVVSGHAYVGIGSTLQVIDVSNPAAPATVGSFPTGAGTISACESLGNYLYIPKMSEDAIQIYDITNPAQPLLASTFNIINPLHLILAPGNLAYVTRQSSPAKIAVLDITNPVTPVQIGQAVLAGNVTGPPALNGKYIFEFYFHSINEQYGLAIVDVSDPQNPQYIGDVFSPHPPGVSPFRVMANDTHVFVNNMSYRLTGLTFSNPLVSTMYMDGSEQTTAFTTSFDGTLTFENAANSFAGLGTGLTALNASNISTGTLSDGRLGGTYSTALTFSNPANSISGNFSGNGSGLVSLNASNLSTGMIDNARTSGTPANLGNALVLRDAAGNFSAATASLTGLQATGPGRFTGSGGFSIGSDSGQIRIDSGGAAPQLFRFLSSVNQYTGIRTRQASVGGNFGDFDAPDGGMIVQGNVGIGTSNPHSSYRLTLEGDGISSPEGGIAFKQGANSGVFMGYPTVSDSVNFELWNNNNGYLRFGTNGQERIRITSAGRVGIGTSVPSTGLHVQTTDNALRADTTSAGGDAVHAISSASTGGGIALRARVDSASGYAGYFEGVAGSRNYFERTTGIGRVPQVNMLELEGNASKTTSGSWLANSDRRIKTEIRDVDDALNLIDRIRPVAFRYTPQYLAAHPCIEDVEYYNVIAQEFAQVFPDSVKDSGEKLANGETILQVDVHPMLITTVAAVQQLHGIVREKDVENADLRARIETLERQVQQLLANSSGAKP